MNRELIKKYKKEFNHWLDCGELLYWSGIQWDKVLNGFNWHTMGPIIINDEYVEFRKALAEGKTVQYNPLMSTHDRWDDIPTGNKLSPTRSDSIRNYRIKPDEPEFKAGDWVTQNSSKPFQFTENTCFLGLELWKPQPEEYCWFCMEDYNPILMQYFGQGDWDIIEPFIGTLPSFLQN